MFPRVVQGTPVLFPANRRYAEDYGLWCRLSRLGRVVCPEQVIYRYRQHPSSITSLDKSQQDDCFATLRCEYQTRHVRSEVPPEITTDVSRFWNLDGGEALRIRFHRAIPIFTELRANFLAYVGQRYGPSDRATLEADLDRAGGLTDRLGYWLFRSIRFADANSCREILAIASARQEVTAVTGKALRRAARAILRRVR